MVVGGGEGASPRAYIYNSHGILYLGSLHTREVRVQRREYFYWWGASHLFNGFHFALELLTRRFPCLLCIQILQCFDGFHVEWLQPYLDHFLQAPCQCFKTPNSSQEFELAIFKFLIRGFDKLSSKFQIIESLIDPQALEYLNKCRVAIFKWHVKVGGVKTRINCYSTKGAWKPIVLGLTKSQLKFY